MPLVEAVLASKLQAAFEQPASTAATCARQWADAVRDYAAPIVPPSTTVAAAADALAASLVSAFGTLAAVPAMESGFASFGVAVGGGMAGFTPVPPSGLVGFAAQFAGPVPQTSEAAAAQIAARIHAWMLTGTTTLIAPPNTLTPWR